jgi:hypothetical protein
MANPMAMVGMGASALGGVFGAMGAETSAKGQQLGIQGQILNTVGGIFNLQTQAQQYGYQANISDYQAGVAKVNKQIAEQNAAYAMSVGDVEAEMEGMKTRAGISQMWVHEGSSGIDVNSASFQDVRKSMTGIGQYSEAMIRANAAKVAYGYDVEAMQDEAQAGLYTYTAGVQRTQAANFMSAAGLAEQAIPLQQQAYSLAGTAGDIGAVSSLLGGVGSVASKWMNWQRYNPNATV